MRIGRLAVKSPAEQVPVRRQTQRGNDNRSQTSGYQIYGVARRITPVGSGSVMGRDRCPRAAVDPERLRSLCHGGCGDGISGVLRSAGAWEWNQSGAYVGAAAD